jgi:hypothetical protein
VVKFSLAPKSVYCHYTTLHLKILIVTGITIE